LSDDFKFHEAFNDGAPATETSNSATDRLMDLVEQTRANLLRTQRRIERTERQYESLMRHIQALWLFVGLVVIGGAALSWYEFSTLSRQAQALTGQSLFPDLKGAVTRDDSAKPAENSPVISKSSLPTVSPDLSKQHSEVPVQPSPAPAAEPVRKTTNEAGPASASRTPSGNRKEAADVSKIDKLSDGIRRQRVDFAVTSNKTEQISPGLYLTINETNVRQQAVDGWLQIASDGHTVWILGQEAEKVLIFGKKKDPRPIALVFTHVEPNRVSGYLMLPQSEAAG